MSKQRATTAERLPDCACAVYARVDEDIYTLMLAKLPLGFPDRLNIATVAGYLAAIGRNPGRIAASMGRSEPWVRQRIRAVERLLLDSAR